MRFVTRVTSLIAAIAFATAAIASPLTLLNSGPGQSGEPAPPPDPVEAVFLHDALVISCCPSTREFTSVPFGTDVANRRIVVAVAGVSSSGSRSISSVVIGDDATGTIAAGAGSNQMPYGLYIGSPTGTSGTITVTFTAGTSSTIVGVYSFVKGNETVSATGNAVSSGSGSDEYSSTAVHDATASTIYIGRVWADSPGNNFRDKGSASTCATAAPPLPLTTFSGNRDVFETWTDATATVGTAIGRIVGTSVSVLPIVCLRAWGADVSGRRATWKP